MSHSYKKDDPVHHLAKGPQGRIDDSGSRKIFTVMAQMPIEADGRKRYRIRAEGENIERVAFENELSRTD